MGILDSPARNVARTLIGQFGRRMVLRRKAPQEYDPAEGSTSDAGAGPVDQVVRGIFERFKARFAEGEEDARADAQYQVTIAAAGLIRNEFVDRPPETGDYVILDAQIAGSTTNPIVDGGTEYRVVHVDPTYSGDEVAVYVLHVAR